VFTARYGLNL